MKKLLQKFVITAAALGGFAGATPALSNTINFDTPVATGAAQAPNTWYTDRFAPASFSSPVAYGGHATTLEVGISGADLQGVGFYNTQGRKLDLASNTTSMSIELFIDNAFGTGPDRRIAGFWGTAFDASATLSAYPIIELARVGGNLVFKGWDNSTGTFSTLGLPSGFTAGSWQTLNIDLLTGSDQFKYTIGDLSLLTGAFGSTSIGNTILQAHNTGQDYTVHWDTLQTSSAVPEPATWAMLIVGFGGVGTAMRRRDRSRLATA
jgi:hypothetical protein